MVVISLEGNDLRLLIGFIPKLKIWLTKMSILLIFFVSVTIAAENRFFQVFDIGYKK